ncbi:MAG: SLBB domain-containing protein [Candidatus Rokubacteria bacterium]|nr:SLBB domain-containing protein [Candidatus Rokubacteria bacterium]
MIPVRAPQLQARIQALEAKVQELTEAESPARPQGPPGTKPVQGTQVERGTAPYDPFAIPIRQYGYALFTTNVSTFAPVDDIPVGPDYVIGPGDDLVINTWGTTDGVIARTVDRNGRIVLPKVGDLRIWGLTFAQADRLIREQLSRYFRGYQSSITMGRLRTIRVHVVGETCQPGSYLLSSLSSLTTALFSAGGPTKLGSLRDIRLMRGDRVVGTLDLYDFLQRGDRTRDYRLESGDTIFVPTIGEVAAIAGEVKRPAIYELRGNVRVADFVKMAGGVTPSSYLKRVQLVRALPSAERVTIDVDLSDYYLKQDVASNPLVNAGDLVLIHRSDPRVYNTVKVEGAVKYPGVYELKPMMRVSQLLPSERLLPEAFLEAVEIARRRSDHSLEVVQVNLKKAWSGDAEQNLLLKPLDEIAVRTELREAGTVTLSGQIVRPGKYVITPGERLSSVLTRAGGFSERAHLKGAVFTRASLRRSEQEQLDAFVRVQEQRVLSAAGTVVVGGDQEGTAVSGQAIQARLDLLRTLAKRVALGRVVLRLAPPEQLKTGGDDVVLIDGDTLDVPEPSASVLVIGAVRNSTSVSYVAGSTVDYYINRVGGLSNEADKKGVHLVKADGSTLAGFADVRTVDPGDTVVVPPKEDTKVRVVPTIRDAFSILGSTLQTVLSAAALAILFQ